MASGDLSGSFTGDFDTASIKCAASKAGYPTEAQVRLVNSTTLTEVAPGVWGKIINARVGNSGTLLNLNVGDTGYISWFGYSELNGTGNEQSAMGKASHMRGAAFIPKVTESFSRSGSTTTLTIDISDLRLKITAVEWKSQTQGGTETSYSGTWTSSTGTAGSDATLTRSKSVTLEDGKDVIVTWRISFTDENGAAKTISRAVSMANMSSLTKTIRIPYGELIPESSSTGWGTTTWSIYPTFGNTSKFYGSVVIPPGVTITKFSARTTVDTGAPADSAEIKLIRTGDGASTTLATLAPATGTTTTSSATLSETVSAAGNNAYTLSAELVSNSNGIAGPGFLWAEIEYDTPNYSTTY